MQYQFTTYGLRISANVAVPGLPPADFDDADADFVVELGAFPEPIAAVCAGPGMPWIEDASHPEGVAVTTLRDGRYVRFRYDWGVEFVFESAGRHIWGVWDPERSLQDAALYLTGPILGFLLRLRGRTCLHASAVSVDGQVVAMVGTSGIGKSTMAFALGQRGHPIVADDIVVVREADGQFLAEPAHGRLRVWPDAVIGLDGASAARPRLIEDWEKCYVDLLDGSIKGTSGPLPLAQIHLLHPTREELDTPQVVRVRPAEAVPLLAANTYRNELLNEKMRAEEFACLTRLVADVPVYRTTYAAGLERLPTVCDAIVATAAMP